MKVMTIFGTRPEAIKMAPVIRALQADHRFQTITCVTAQHRHMLDQVLSSFNITPDIDLNIMTPNQTLPELTAGIILKVTEVLKKVKPDKVLVHGDTSTTLAAALAAFYAGIPVGHVEAGLRSFNQRSPFPEETHRVLTSHIATWHFAPTELNKQYLLAEGIPQENIFVTGNTVIDALLWAKQRYSINAPIPLALKHIEHVLTSPSPILLITGHRRENIGKGCHEICSAIAKLATQHSDWHFIYPVHLNPAIKDPVNASLQSIANVYLIPPQEYVPFVYLMDRSTLILTDSGGIQEEAPSLGKPVLVMRENTERQEALSAGVMKLVGADSQSIVDNVNMLMGDSMAYRTMSACANPYGDGRAAERIISALSL